MTRIRKLFYGITTAILITLFMTINAQSSFCQIEKEGVKRLVGCVESGVEGGCLMLITRDNTKYNISSARRKPKAGTWIIVRGTRYDNYVSFCMEGIPIKVRNWKKLGYCEIEE